MSNEMMAHALRPRILLNFCLVCCPIIQINIYPKFELPTPSSFSVKIIFVTHGRARF